MIDKHDYNFKDIAISADKQSLKMHDVETCIHTVSIEPCSEGPNHLLLTALLYFTNNSL